VGLRGRFALVEFLVRDRTEAFIQEQLDDQTEHAFRRLFEQNRLKFFLKCAECRFEIPDFITVTTTRRLLRDDSQIPAKSLFDYVDESEVNDYERAIALWLDDHDEVLWWYRIRSMARHFKY
jgi:hypothetical protein